MNKNQAAWAFFILCLVLILAFYVKDSNPKTINLNFVFVAPTQDNSKHIVSTNISIEKLEGNGNVFGDYASVFNLLKDLRDGEV